MSQYSPEVFWPSLIVLYLYGFLLSFVLYSVYQLLRGLSDG